MCNSGTIYQLAMITKYVFAMCAICATCAPVWPLTWLQCQRLGHAGCPSSSDNSRNDFTKFFMDELHHFCLVLLSPPPPPQLTSHPQLFKQFSGPWHRFFSRAQVGGLRDKGDMYNGRLHTFPIIQYSVFQTLKPAWKPSFPNTDEKKDDCVGLINLYPAVTHSPYYFL